VAESSISSFIERLVAAPVGVTLLDRLEAEARDDWLSFDCLPDSIPAAVAAAREMMSQASFGSILDTALRAGMWLTGPWVGDAPENLALAYRHAPLRRPIAEAFAERFWSELHGSVQGGSTQQWWEFRDRLDDPARVQRPDYEVVYGNGEFTFGGNWTATDPPAEVLDTLASAWEMNEVSRWLLPVRPGARVWTIDRPGDWVRLAENYPKVATKPHDGWELPGPNQHRRNISDLLEVAGQRGVRASIERQVLPDWRAVSADFDGVHLSWAGYLTSEGYISDMRSGGVTMLRYWFSERTLWLNDVFDDAVFLDFPVQADSQSEIDYELRKTEDLRRIHIYLGRPDSAE
jgi:hypothetical protein